MSFDEERQFQRERARIERTKIAEREAQRIAEGVDAERASELARAERAAATAADQRVVATAENVRRTDPDPEPGQVFMDDGAGDDEPVAVPVPTPTGPPDDGPDIADPADDAALIDPVAVRLPGPDTGPDGPEPGGGVPDGVDGSEPATALPTATGDITPPAGGVDEPSIGERLAAAIMSGQTGGTAGGFGQVDEFGNPILPPESVAGGIGIIQAGIDRANELSRSAELTIGAPASIGGLSAEELSLRARPFDEVNDLRLRVAEAARQIPDLDISVPTITRQRSGGQSPQIVTRGFDIPVPVG